MKHLNPDKLHVIVITDDTSGINNLPRRYTLTHSDLSGNLFLTIGDDYDKKQISRLHTRLMRDEVLAELINNRDLVEFRVYCHVSGGLVIGTAKWRNSIFHAELPLAIEAIRHGDKTFFETNPYLDQTPVNVYFHSHTSRYNHVENWGAISDYT